MGTISFLGIRIKLNALFSRIHRIYRHFRNCLPFHKAKGHNKTYSNTVLLVFISFINSVSLPQFLH